MAAATKTAEISKMDAVRQAIEELGKDAMPGAIQEFVKKLGVEMSLSHVSNYKSIISKGKKTGKKPAAVASAETTPAPAPMKPAPVKPALAPKNGSAVSIEDIEAIKKLVGRVGEENLKSLVVLLG